MSGTQLKVSNLLELDKAIIDLRGQGQNDIQLIMNILFGEPVRSVFHSADELDAYQASRNVYADAVEFATPSSTDNGLAWKDAVDNAIECAEDEGITVASCLRKLMMRFQPVNSEAFVQKYFRPVSNASSASASPASSPANTPDLLAGMPPLPSVDMTVTSSPSIPMAPQGSPLALDRSPAAARQRQEADAIFGAQMRGKFPEYAARQDARQKPVTNAVAFALSEKQWDFFTIIRNAYDGSCAKYMQLTQSTLTRDAYKAVLEVALKDASKVSKQTANDIMESNGKTFNCWDSVVSIFCKNHKTEKALKLEIGRVAREVNSPAV